MLWSCRRFDSSPKISTPTKVPAMPPRPPIRLVPPITTAAMASSSSPWPASGLPWRYCATKSTAATPASIPEMRVGGDLGPRDVDAREPRRLLVAADGVDVAAERGEAQHRAVEDHRGEEEQARHRHDPEDQAAQPVELGHRVRAGIDRQHRVVLPGGQPRHPERGHHHRQGHDERLQPAADDDQAVERADDQPDAGGDQQDADHPELAGDLRQQEPERGRHPGQPDRDRQHPPAQRAEPRVAAPAGDGAAGRAPEAEAGQRRQHHEER